MPTAFSHVGVCVSQLEKSIAFYRDGLGFSLAERHEIGSQFAALMELDEVELTSQFLRRGDLSIELLAFSQPEAIGGGRRPVAKLGLTHLCFTVDDVHETAKGLVNLGGFLVEGSSTRVPVGDAAVDLIYLTDPDGTRIELMAFKAPGETPAP